LPPATPSPTFPRKREREKKGHQRSATGARR
jgi:hypothetical protein